ncbi:MAG TPA: sulfate adenylyltransferase, partial [Gammaproteobacteria bacterium]|nr:sulfate adenylyltransferase [Gammaproteobacteria bacterium]
MSSLVKPHGGGDLKPLLLEGDALAAEKERAASLPKVNISSREAGDIIMMGIGGFTPLDGFMTKADWQGVCDGMKMASGLFWPIPVTLSTGSSTADSISEGDDVALYDAERDEILATMTVTDKYSIDKKHECMMVYKTTDVEHPGVKMVMDQADVNLAGPIKVLSQGGFPEAYGDQFMTPAQTRAEFKKRG